MSTSNWENERLLMKTPVIVFVSLIGGILAFVEFVCYVIFFRHVYRHDNQIAALVISQSVLKLRNRSNAVSMLSRFLTWILRIWYVALAGVLSTLFKVENLKEMSALVKSSEFCLIPLLQIVTTASIKHFLRTNYKTFSKTQN
jgi:uncharacterized paraquat-inducible protein A